MPEEKSASQVALDALTEVSEWIMHELGGEAKFLAELPAYELFALTETGYQAGMAINKILQGDGDQALDHVIAMSNAALSGATWGYLGAVQASVDAAAALARHQGHHSVTVEEAERRFLEEHVGHLMDRVYFALHPGERPDGT